MNNTGSVIGDYSSIVEIGNKLTDFRNSDISNKNIYNQFENE